MILLWSEIPSGICAKLRTVAASNDRDHPTRSLYYCLFAPHTYIFVLRAHPVRGESHNQPNTTGEVATIHVCPAPVLVDSNVDIRGDYAAEHEITFNSNKTTGDLSFCPKKCKQPAPSNVFLDCVHIQFSVHVQISWCIAKCLTEDLR